MKKTALAALAAVSMLCLTVPAFAEAAAEQNAAAAVAAAAENVPYTYTSPDGVISIDLPNQNWKEMQDDTKWLVFSDGANMISIDHLSNGEALPAMSVADEHYVNVYQAVFSTQNEVFIITGSVVDAAVIPNIAKSILSAKVLQYDTKQAVKKETAETAATTTTAAAGGAAAAAPAASSGEYSIAPMSATMYATAGVNVRASYSTNDAVIGGLGVGSSVNVTGKVQKGGQDFGWYQVSYNGGTGYVSASFLSSTAPQTEKPASTITFTGKACTIYALSGTAITIYEGSDNKWYDSKGVVYTWLTGDKLESSGGEAFTTYNSATTGSYPTSSGFTVYWANGNAETLTPYSDGTVRSSSGVNYTDVGNGTYAGYDGTTLYTWIPDVGGSEHGISSQGSGRPAIVWTNDEGDYVDGDGNTYYDQGDGTFISDSGDTYDIEW